MAFHNDEAVLDIGDKPKFGQWVAAFNPAPFCHVRFNCAGTDSVGLDPSIALFSSGVGTLVYILITRGKISAYMGIASVYHDHASFDERCGLSSHRTRHRSSRCRLSHRCLDCCSQRISLD